MSAIDRRHALRELVQAGEVAQAVELARALPELVPMLEAALRQYADRRRPEVLLSTVVDGDALHRELVRYALFCARSVEHLWNEDRRPVLSCCLDTVDRWLAGEATAEECQRAADAAYAAADIYAAYAAADIYAAYAYAAAYAAYASVACAAGHSGMAAKYASAAAADAAANAASRTAQRRYLADRVAAYLRGEE